MFFKTYPTKPFTLSKTRFFFLIPKPYTQNIKFILYFFGGFQRQHVSSYPYVHPTQLSMFSFFLFFFLWVGFPQKNFHPSVQHPSRTAAASRWATAGHCRRRRCAAAWTRRCRRRCWADPARARWALWAWGNSKRWPPGVFWEKLLGKKNTIFGTFLSF